MASERGKRIYQGWKSSQEQLRRQDERVLPFFQKVANAFKGYEEPPAKLGKGASAREIHNAVSYVHYGRDALREIKRVKSSGGKISDELSGRVANLAHGLLEVRGDNAGALEANYLGAQLYGEIGRFDANTADILERALARVGPSVGKSDYRVYFGKFLELDKKYLLASSSSGESARNFGKTVESRLAVATILLGGVSFVFGMALSSPSILGDVIFEEGSGVLSSANLFLYGGAVLLIAGLLVKTFQKRYPF